MGRGPLIESTCSPVSDSPGTCSSHGSWLPQKSAFKGYSVHVVTALCISGSSDSVKTHLPSSLFTFLQGRAAEQKLHHRPPCRSGSDGAGRKGRLGCCGRVRVGCAAAAAGGSVTGLRPGVGTETRGSGCPARAGDRAPQRAPHTDLGLSP